MADIFLSYTSADYDVAERLYNVLSQKGYDVWFAPCNIGAGNNYADDIGRALSTLDDGEDFFENIERLAKSKILLLILSKDSMKSKWVAKEVKMAVNEDIHILPLHIDNIILNSQFKFMLSDVQIMEAQFMNKKFMDNLFDVIDGLLEGTPIPPPIEKKMEISYDEIKVYPIAQGDPYYKADETLKIRLTGESFFISPPYDEVQLTESQAEWARTHLAEKTEVFGLEWEDILKGIPIPDLMERINESRRRIFMQFVNHENGCYFNNKKFGVNSINRFGRTEDLAEKPILMLEMFTTDYYTHRVMKDVCKQLVREDNEFILHQLNFDDMEYTRIFFTSLGVNLLLFEDELKKDRNVILTSRSVNAAETYSSHQYSVSVIEGVSYSDYDAYTNNVNLRLAVQRGLLEELGVGEHLIKSDKLKFYDLFINMVNLEMGISCSVELKKNIGIESDILKCHGKDEQLEIADKTCLKAGRLKKFMFMNKEAFLTQAIYTIVSYLESVGDFVVERFNKKVEHKQSFIMSKDGSGNICGDAIVDTENFIAVIDGATPKGKRSWNGLRGDIFIAHLIGDAVKKMDRDISAEEAVIFVNNEVSKAYKESGIIFDELQPEERLQASMIIYSIKRHEVWSFGDCLLRINGRDYSNTKKLDGLMSNLRAFFVELEMIKGNHSYSRDGVDFGREKILPFLKEQNLFANTNYSFGYDVIDGGDIIASNVLVYAVQTGDRVTMSTDGYPKLFDTLEDSEKYLAQCIKNDPECIYELRGTKGIASGNISYDDRAYIGFSVE